jgi:glycosyltransferase involved in cell wall biosynthesis
MDRKKAVVLITPGFTASEDDTTWLPFLQQFVSAFTSLRPGIELRIITLHYPLKQMHYKWKGVNVYSTGGRGKLYSRPQTFARVWKELNSIQRVFDIAVMQSFWLTDTTLIAQRYCKKHNIQHVAYAIGQDVLKTNKYLKLLNLSTIQVVAMSQSIVNKCFETTGHKISKIIPMGIVDEEVAMPNEPRTIDVIGIGSLIPLKNYLLFAEIIAELKKDFPELKAMIIGTGEQEHLIKEKIKSEGLENTLEMIGTIPHKEVLAYMNRSKILLHTSSYEGQSTVIMEALAMGLHIVCFDVGRVDNEKIRACKGKDEMLKQLKALLLKQLDYKKVIPCTSFDTANAFIRLYGI